MEDGQTPFTSWVKTNASTANLLSIIMLIFAAWAAVEIVTNVTGSEVPPVTGMETNDDPNDTQRVNNGAIIGLGAVAGTLGIILQLLIPRDGSSDIDDSIPREDEEIDEVVDVMMDDIESDDDDEGSEEESSDEAPIVRLVNRLFEDAVVARASDIHIEPFADRVRIRFRVDGKLKLNSLSLCNSTSKYTGSTLCPFTGPSAFSNLPAITFTCLSSS